MIIIATINLSPITKPFKTLIKYKEKLNALEVGIGVSLLTLLSTPTIALAKGVIDPTRNIKLSTFILESFIVSRQMINGVQQTMYVQKVNDFIANCPYNYNPYEILTKLINNGTVKDVVTANDYSVICETVYKAFKILSN